MGYSKSMIELDGYRYYIRYPYIFGTPNFEELTCYYDAPTLSLEAITYYFMVPFERVFTYSGLTDLLYLLFSSILRKRVYLLSCEFPFYRLILAQMKIDCIEILQTPDLCDCKKNVLKVLSQCSNSEVFLLSRPNSVSGSSISLVDLEEVLSAYPDLIVIVDEAYQVYSSQESALGLLEKYPNIVCLKGASKEFMLPSIRMAWLLTSNIALLDRLARSTYNTISRLSEHIVYDLVMNQRQVHTKNVIHVMNERDRLFDSLLSLKSFYIFSSDSCTILLKVTQEQYRETMTLCQQLKLRPLYLNEFEIYKNHYEPVSGGYFIRLSVWSMDINNTILKMLAKVAGVG